MSLWHCISDRFHERSYNAHKMGQAYLELIQKITGVVPGTIIKGHGNVAGIDTIIDTNTTVFDAAHLGPCYSRRIDSGWFRVAVTPRTIAKLTIWGLAVVNA